MNATLFKACGMYADLRSMGLTDCGLRYTSSPWMRRNIDRWWKPLLVANRHGFDWRQVRDMADWFDYCENLQYLGLDTHSPKYIAPADFKQAHDTMSHRAHILYERRRVERERREQLERERRYEEQAERDKKDAETYAGRMGALLGLVIVGKGITIKPLQSVGEFMDEGKAMHHCVFANRYYAKDYALIMSARDEQGNRLETIEVNTDEYRIIQSRAVNNGTSPRHNDIVGLVNSKMSLIRQLDKERKSKNKKVALSA
ncbi:MAG: PcfJ domain-containing protein [Bacteroidaceae bacterium]|nr:PcfJ domain-containing protein [Bacteroidaceae bacterium]